MKRALDEVLNVLDKDADGETDQDVSVTADVAGRLKLDGVTIDSPLQNIALYDYIMKNPGANVLPEGYDDLDTAASLFGAASDKTTPITIDTLVYSNTILGLNTNDAGEVEYYNFDGYDYSRLEKFSDVDVSWFEGDADGNGQLDPHTVSVLHAVFGDQNLKPEDRVGQEWVDGTPEPGIDDFVQAADDARAVIDFMHTYMAEPVATMATSAYSGLGYGMAYGADGDCPLADGTCPLLA